ncbi:MAG: ABC transporter ATP-binding protein [Acidimicrobiia bacterium]|nr:ABC transporter ATP-binding protein [Acidimicrobiia bacterium]
MGAAIAVEGLRMQYGDFVAVDGIDLEVAEGEILAFLGANGAGKTTTIEILEGFRSRTSGRVEVLGHDPETAPLSWREDIGIVLQESEPVPELTAGEAVRMQAAYYSNPRDAAETLRLVGLEDSADQRTRKLSGGQKRRLDLAMALVGNPSLVFLDEPTTGFDPSARRESWGMIEALRDLGKTVLLTTHYMDEAEHLADRIVVIGKGEIVARGTANELAEQVQARTQVTWKPSPTDPRPPDRLGAHIDEMGRVQIETTDSLVTLNELTNWAIETGVDLPELNVARPTLEDIYLQLTDDVQGEGGAPS